MNDIYTNEALADAEVAKNMPDELKHIKVTTIEVYTDGLLSMKKQYSKNILTDRNSVLGDLISCLDVLTDGTSDTVIIEVKAKHKTPSLIIKTWTPVQERYGHA